MTIIETSYERFGSLPLCLGREGENGVTQIRIDVTGPKNAYPNAWFAIQAESPDGIVYPAVTETIGEQIIWTICSTDTSRSGKGKAQAVMYGQNGEIGRSKEVNTLVLSSLMTGEQIPIPAENWIDEAQKLLEELKNYELPTEEIKELVKEYLNEFAPEDGSFLPAVTEKDNGKVLQVVNGIWAAAELKTYQGNYSVTPAPYDKQTLQTDGLLMTDDVTIHEIPYYETSNTSDGTTVYIGKEVEIYGS